MFHRRTLGTMFAAIALGVAACGDDDNGDTTTDTEPPAEEPDDTVAEEPEEPDEPADEEATPEGEADVQVGETPLGDVLVDAEGRTLYGFLQDGDGLPTCTDECADAWPALLVEGEPTLDPGLDPEIFSTVDGADGGTQVVADVWPLYTFSGDAGPGDVNGQGVVDAWFAVGPDGSLVDGPDAAGAADEGDGGGGPAGY